MSGPSETKKRRTRPRALGWAFLIMTTLVLMAAWNTGSNLLYVIASGLAGFVVVSLLLAGRPLRRLRVIREAPNAVHRGDTFATNVRIENLRRAWPALSVRIENGSAQNKAAAYLPAVPAGKAAALQLAERFDKRGVRRLAPVTLATTFPLGLLESRRLFDDALEVVVYPRVWAVRPSVLNQLTGTGRAPRRARGDGDEYFSLRDYMAGDDIRRVAWRISARRGRLMVKEFEPSSARFVVFALDTERRDDVDAFDDRFEDAVELVASLAVTMLNRQYAVAIAAGPLSLRFGEGHTQTLKVLELLARVTPTEPGAVDIMGKARGLAESVGGAAYAFVSPDPARWGRRSPALGGPVLDPREVLRA